MIVIQKDGIFLRRYSASLASTNSTFSIQSFKFILLVEIIPSSANSKSEVKKIHPFWRILILWIDIHSAKTRDNMISVATKMHL